MTPHCGRRPTPEELGLNVTIGIAATAFPGYIVAATDNRISFDDIYPAAERGARKILRVSDNWYISFAATNVAVLKQIVQDIIRDVSLLKAIPSSSSMIQIAEKSYAERLKSDFAKKHLVQFGYQTVEDFRREGLQDLGKDNYDKYIRMLATHDLGAELMIFGHVGQMPHLFVVNNPGRAEDRYILGYGVVGSGSMMALAALRRKPMPPALSDVIYRVLEAKFSSETASHVGPSTSLTVVNRDGHAGEFTEDEIEAVRKIWKRTLDEPSPKEALELIKRTGAVDIIRMRNEPSSEV